MAGTTEGSLVETSEVLNKAADLIEERGWHQGGTGYGTGGGLCAINACAEVNDGNWLDATGRIAEHVGTSSAFVAGWNDLPGRTAAEVIEVLRACALIEAAREEQDAAEVTYAVNLAVTS